MAFRFHAVTALFLAAFGALGWNLYNLQVERGAFYIERAQARAEALKALELRRGQILFTDRSGTAIPVALNRDYPVVYAVPREVADVRETAARLAPLVGLSEPSLAAALGNQRSLFKLLVDKAPPRSSMR